MDKICDLMQPFDSKWIVDEMDDESVKNIPYSMIPWKQLLGTTEENTSVTNRLFAVLYTSGSTGRPKGARILHSGVINRLEWQWNEFPYHDEDVCVFKVTLLGFFVRDYTTSNENVKRPLLELLKDY